MAGPGFRIAAAWAYADSHGLGDEAARIRSMTIHPSIVRGSAVRKGCLVELFEMTGVMDDFIAQHWPARHTPAGEKRRAFFLQRKKLNEDRLAGKAAPEPSEADVSDPDEPALFALEAHLRDFIAANLVRVPIASGQLKLYKDAKGRSGVEYPTAVGPIDILAQDAAGTFYVFELKLERGPDRALGQLARYMGWVKLNLAGGKNVVGIVVASSIDQKLRYAACVVPGVVLLEYQLAFIIRAVDAMSAGGPSTLVVSA